MLKRIIYFGLLFLLCFPLIQLSTDFIQERPLLGQSLKVEKPKFSWEGWLSSEFQTDFGKYIDQNMGLRGFFIRTYNQLQYSFFNATNAEKVVIGKEGILFEDSYITSYLGQNLRDSALIHQKLKRASFLAKELEKVGKHLIIVIAPDKASYYPEKIPDRYVAAEAERSFSSNYKQYQKALQKYDLHHIDFNQIFIAGKDTAKVPMFPKSGIHWSNYYSVMAMDSLRRYFKKQFEIDLPQPYVEQAEITERQPANPDYDLGDLLNILSEEYGKTIQGEVKFKNKEKKKGSVLTIGDSFYWNLYYQGMMDNLFESAEFWYYNHLIYPQSFDKEITTDKINIRKKLQEVDLVMILITSGAMDNFGFGFIDQSYQALQIKEDVQNAVLQHLIQKMKNDQNWLSDIDKKAKEKGVTTDEMLSLDANYLLLNLSDEELKSIRIEIFELRITSTPEWLENVKQKAAEKNISLQEAIRQDAIFCIETQDQDPILK